MWPNQTVQFLCIYTLKNRYQTFPVKHNMGSSARIVTQIPLNELWTPSQVLETNRIRLIRKNDLIGILRQTPVEFVVANIGYSLNWVPIDQCYPFW